MTTFLQIFPATFDPRKPPQAEPHRQWVARGCLATRLKVFNFLYQRMGLYLALEARPGLSRRLEAISLPLDTQHSHLGDRLKQAQLT